MAYYTGLPDGQTFETLFAFLGASNDTLVSSRQIRPEDRRRSAGGGAKKDGVLSLKEQLFLTLVRLRRGLDEELLADILHISQPMVSRVLLTWINFLYLRLSTIPIWPSPEAVEQNLPTAFKSHYASTAIIVDCSELRCEVPSSLPLQSQLYSSYKSHTTLKGLLGITPSGAVSFISELFTGSISDREIFQECGIVDMLKTLPRGKSMMADKGFDVEDLLAPAGLKVNIPPMKGSKQLSEADVLRTQRIARVRIHVERAIARVKNFSVLDQVIPLTLLGSVNQIWTICCMLTNFQPPLLDV